jgi:polyisoprenoid-binding protein YceI
MKKLVAVAVALLVAVVGGSWFYVKVLTKPDAKLTLNSSPATTSASASASSDDGTTDGSWKASRDSIVGYRVKETLFGASNTATGRTSSVTGSIAINGTTVSDGSFTVDMNSVSSDKSMRDGQFRGRIMNTSQFPTATFKLTSPITLSSVDMNKQISATATGNLTLHGVTKKVTFDVVAERVTGQIKVNGTIPVHFSDYSINNPSGGPAQVGDDGTLEFTLVFTR